MGSVVGTRTGQSYAPHNRALHFHQAPTPFGSVFCRSLTLLVTLFILLFKYLDLVEVLGGIVLSVDLLCWDLEVTTKFVNRLLLVVGHGGQEGLRAGGGGRLLAGRCTQCSRGIGAGFGGKDLYNCSPKSVEKKAVRKIG